jgi:ferredoxin
MCKHTDCVEVCPVDCFYEGENMLVINPDECIDCGVCEPECPEDAILPDTDEQGARWVDFNSKWSKSGWPVITEIKDSLDPDGKHKNEPNKLEKYFKNK